MDVISSFESIFTGRRNRTIYISAFRKILLTIANSLGCISVENLLQLKVCVTFSDNTHSHEVSPAQHLNFWDKLRNIMWKQKHCT